MTDGRAGGREDCPSHHPHSVPLIGAGLLGELRDIPRRDRRSIRRNLWRRDVHRQSDASGRFHGREWYSLRGQRHAVHRDAGSRIEGSGIRLFAVTPDDTARKKPTVQLWLHFHFARVPFRAIRSRRAPSARLATTVPGSTPAAISMLRWGPRSWPWRPGPSRVAAICSTTWSSRSK